MLFRSSDAIPVNLEEGPFHRVYAGERNSENIALAQTEGAGFFAVNRGEFKEGEIRLLPYPSIFMAVALAVQSKGQATQFLAAIMRKLTGNEFITESDVKHIYKISSDEAIHNLLEIFKILEVRAVQKLDIDQALDLERLLLKAFDAAA